MCFSMQADVAAGGALLPVAALALREVRHLREVPFAALPLLFSAHQFVEAFVWAGVDGDVSSATAHTAAITYLVFALPVLPSLVPIAVLLLEPRGARLRVAPFAVLGVVVSGYLGVALARGPVDVVPHAHALEYSVHLDAGVVWAVLYVVAVIGPSVLSGYRSIVVFGVLNLIGLSLAAVLYVSAFASVWCVFAAMTSLLVLVHLYRRRHLSDDERLRGLSQRMRNVPGAGVHTHLGSGPNS
ncbi:MAG: hypothetical protein L0H31_00645 [Nocardioidaceae bacterium]|nr:hypothetical protein [Nocardioidaceae bacterium]